MSGEDQYRGVPQDALHLNQKPETGEKQGAARGPEGDSSERAGLRERGEELTRSSKSEAKPSEHKSQASNKSAKEGRDNGGDDQREAFQQRSESTERGGTGPNESVNKI